MNANIIYVFDKGYNDYKAFKLFSENKTGFVTRIKDNAVNELIKETMIEDHVHSGVHQDEIIKITVKETSFDLTIFESKLKLCKIRFYDRVLKREFEF